MTLVTEDAARSLGTLEEELVDALSQKVVVTSEERDILDKLIDDGDNESIVHFFLHITHSGELRSYIGGQIDELLSNSRLEDLRGLIASAKRASLLVVALEDFSRSANILWGANKERIAEELVYALQIEGEFLEELSSSIGNVPGNAGIIAKSLNVLALNGLSEGIAKKAENLVSGPIAQARETAITISKYAQKLCDCFRGDPLEVCIERVMRKMVESAEDELVGINASLRGIPGIIRRGGPAYAGFDGHDLWDKFDYMSSAELDEKLEYSYGIENPVIERIHDFLNRNQRDRKVIAKRMFICLGEPLTDLLCKAAKRIVKKIGNGPQEEKGSAPGVSP